MTTDREAARTDLTDLTRERMTELGISVRTLAARTIDPHPELQPKGESRTGPLWTRATLQNLLSGTKAKAPTPAELRALAAGLELPMRAVQDAAIGQWFERDVFYTSDATVRTIVHHAEELSEEDRRKVLEIIEEFRNR
ncbi:XRE family transcriptional regulator [Streptomyces sp. CC228A]|uniref:XRE family transcriptional regulator n=1 Tax=Streptomyces sp. CC228A TaxID=2898186 RepID=UPI001F187BFC|nr:XRE family transcriptional regulator [Streptomyces sp. CC228A]